MTDPIADMLTRIRNAQRAKKREAVLSSSKLKRAIADILVREGYLDGIKVTGETPNLLVLTLKYDTNREPAIHSIVRESTPGHRMYRKSGELLTVLNGYGIAIVSTPRGLMTSKEAKKMGVGGEVICSVY